eukprot:TRINITY_DN1538_c0_g1_i1.p1 TRINITY_DN1538_c0_g1~~TRINITY_DN1538_c0_g1_i1.p1  ORF type:complete len:890 (-),score=201.33 TRINITY_DN1538_c0_g1_i1:132-2801(-)
MEGRHYHYPQHTERGRKPYHGSAALIRSDYTGEYSLTRVGRPCIVEPLNEFRRREVCLDDMYYIVPGEKCVVRVGRKSRPSIRVVLLEPSSSSNFMDPPQEISPRRLLLRGGVYASTPSSSPSPLPHSFLNDFPPHLSEPRALPQALPPSKSLKAPSSLSMSDDVDGVGVNVNGTEDVAETHESLRVFTSDGKTSSWSTAAATAVDTEETEPLTHQQTEGFATLTLSTSTSSSSLMDSLVGTRDVPVTPRKRLRKLTSRKLQEVDRVEKSDPETEGEEPQPLPQSPPRVAQGQLSDQLLLQGVEGQGILEHIPERYDHDLEEKDYRKDQNEHAEHEEDEEETELPGWYGPMNEPLKFTPSQPSQSPTPSHVHSQSSTSSSFVFRRPVASPASPFKKTHTTSHSSTNTTNPKLTINSKSFGDDHHHHPTVVYDSLDDLEATSPLTLSATYENSFNNNTTTTTKSLHPIRPSSPSPCLSPFAPSTPAVPGSAPFSDVSSPARNVKSPAKENSSPAKMFRKMRHSYGKKVGEDEEDTIDEEMGTDDYEDVTKSKKNKKKRTHSPSHSSPVRISSPRKLQRTIMGPASPPFNNSFLNQASKPNTFAHLVQSAVPHGDLKKKANRSIVIPDSLSQTPSPDVRPPRIERVPDSEESSSDLSGFIVNSSLSPDEEANQDTMTEPSIPEFLRLPPSRAERFHDYVQFLIKVARGKDNGELVPKSGTSIEEEVTSRKELVFRSSVWESSFTHDLERFPTYRSWPVNIGAGKCQACKRPNHFASWAVCFAGPAYRSVALWKKSQPLARVYENEKSGKKAEKERANAEGGLVTLSVKKPQYRLGKHCHQRSNMFHRLHHYKFSLCAAIEKKVQGNDNVETDVAWADNVRCNNILFDLLKV